MIVCQTQDMVDFFPKRISKKCIVIPNPVNPDLPSPFIGQRKKIVVSIGKLQKQKNYKIAIQAFKDFYYAHRDYQYWIYGEGEERNTIEQLIRDLKLNNSVFLKGNVVDPFDYIKDSSIFLLTSDYEGVSNSLIEAMAMGIPCISTNHPIGGAKSLIDNYENGILTDVGNVSQLVCALNYIADHHIEAEKMAVNASKIREKFSISRIVSMWEMIVGKFIKNENISLY